ncbi:MAG: Thymidylate synthase-like protein [Parcubacteria group bacterium GW2011_GWA2_43_17]|nr:MAG: Thymidylate synthase-like protein [Parcubacteria group bacterium GW2011_GWA2_43_17]
MANYKRSTHALVKQAGEELVVLHSKSGNYYTLNPLGRQIWDFCQTPKSEEEIVGFISKEHGVAIETARTDVVDYLESLVAENIFVKYSPEK